MGKILFAYIPVLHLGYWNLLHAHRDADELGLMGSDLIAEFPHLAKNLPALDPALIQQAIISWAMLPSVQLFGFKDMERLHSHPPDTIVAPDEDVTRAILSSFLPNCHVEFVSIFLRRDKQNTLIPQEVQTDLVVSSAEFDRLIMHQAEQLASQSSDFWRQIGAIAVRDGEIILTAWNQHVPSSQTPYAHGDPRGNFKQGIHIELSTADHAEAVIVGEAARRGISLDGADLYVTTFPCPPCAKLVGRAGFGRLFFRSGYSMVDGQSIMRDYGMQIVLVR